MLTDSELLVLFVRDRSENALRSLFDRHLKLVYAAALRQVRDPGMAEDILQGVFIALADKAPKLSSRVTVLPAWLLTATRYAALTALKRRAVRMRFEKEGAVMEHQSPPGNSSEKIGFIIDAALSHLSTPDRTAIAVYYLENRSLRDVSAALAVSESAAHMRISRALLRLRNILTRQGVTCPADALETSLHDFNSVAVSPALLAAAVNSALHRSAATPNGLAIAREISRSMLMKKVKAFALSTLAAATVAVSAIPLVYHAYAGSPPSAAPILVDTPVNHQLSNPISDDIRTAWENGGARSGWMTTDGLWEDSIKGQPGDIPAFRINQWTPEIIAPLPAPDQNFGLYLVRATMTDSGLKELAGLTRLQALNLLFDNHITDAGLRQLSGFTQLQLLNLGNDIHVTDAGLKSLAGLTQLQTLWLTNTHITDTGLIQLAGLTQLRWLDLSGTNVAGSGLGELAGLTQLKRLALDDTQVTDAGLKVLAGLTQLQRLYLTGTLVTDAGLNELAGLKQLQILDVSNTKVTDAGVMELQTVLPNLQIQH